MMVVAVGHCGAFWTCKSAAVCQSCASFGKKRSLQNLIFEIDGQTIPTLIHLRRAKTFLRESLVRGCAVSLNLLEHLKTSLGTMYVQKTI